MISMQSRGMSDRDRERMQSVIGSIQAMAGIHSHLYEDAAWEWVDARDLIRALAEQLPKEPEKPIVFTADIGGLIVDLDTAVALGLIANELLTNSVKYAFPHTDRPEVAISLKREGEALLFTYADNGPGLPDPETQHKGFGSKMLQAMTKKLKAEFHVFNRDGAHAEIRIFRFKLKTDAHTDR
jgi:two-component sensor histidine kinase